MDSVLALRAGDGEDYQIFIPGSWVLDEFEAEILEGTLEGNGVRVLEAELSVREGNAVFTQEDGRSADLECMGSGSILWAMESERYMEIDAECRTGSITISIPETMDPGGIGYDIECENGTVEFPGFTVEGNQKKEAAGSLSVMDLEAGSGTISVQHTAAPVIGSQIKGERNMDVRRLYKSDTDKMICGVCGGIGEFSNVDPTLVRLLWAIPTFTGPGLIAYIIAAIIIPGRPDKNGRNIYGGPGQSHAVRSLFFQRPQRAFPGQGFFHGLRRVLKRICAWPSGRHTGPEGFCISFLFLGILF